MGIKTFSRNLVMMGTLVIWTIKYLLRPYGNFNPPAAFLLGIAPNLLGAFLIPFGACWFFEGRDGAIARLFRIRNVMECRLVCIMGFLLLVINEYLQRIPFFGRTFDYYDILFSLAGLTIGCYVFSRKLLQQEYVSV